MDFLYQRLSGRKLHAETIREIAKGTFEVPQPRFQKALPPVGAVAKKCLALLPEVYEDAKEEAEARRVISDAQEALEGRNRMVHDRWLGVEDDPASVIRLRRTPGGQHGDRLVGATQEPSSLVVFEQTVIDLARVAIRISALLGTIDEEWDLPGSPFTRAKSWEVARGEFELLGTEAYVALPDGAVMRHSKHAACARTVAQLHALLEPISAGLWWKSPCLRGYAPSKPGWSGNQAALVEWFGCSARCGTLDS